MVAYFVLLYRHSYEDIEEGYENISLSSAGIWTGCLTNAN
jgi:hypothetical protein